MESPATETELFAFLDTLGISHTTYRHTPVFTVEEAQAERATMPLGGHSKNLFLRDKRKNYALVVAEESRKIDLRSMAETIGLGRPSFASTERLQAYLGVTPGSVTPFALLNAFTRQAPEHPTIQVVLDEELLAFDTIYFHPLHNSATTAIAPNDLITFMQACGFKPLTLKNEP